MARLMTRRGREHGDVGARDQARNGKATPVELGLKLRHQQAGLQRLDDGSRGRARGVRARDRPVAGGLEPGIAPRSEAKASLSSSDVCTAVATSSGVSAASNTDGANVLARG